MPPAGSNRRRIALLALGLVLLTVVTRLPALLHPQPIDDEEVYSVVAHEMLAGGLPYLDAIERKPPLLFWTYQAVFEACGAYNWFALHALALAWTLLTMGGLFVFTRRLFDAETGLIAALLYSVFQPWATWKNLAFNGELLMNLPLVWGWAIGMGPSRSRLRPELLGAGALLAAGFLLKQPAAIAAVPLGCYLLLPSYRAARGHRPSDSIVQAALLTAGFFGTLGVVAALLWSQGILAEAWYWTFSNHDLPHIFWTRGLTHTLFFVGSCLPLLIGALAGLTHRSPWRERRPEWLALAGLLAVSAMGAAAGGRFYPHYYQQLTPALALLAAPVFARAWQGGGPRVLSPAVAAPWLTITVAVFLVAHWRGLMPQREGTEAGRHLREQAAPGDRLFVWGQVPRIYLDARLRPASRYIATFPLTGFIFGPPLPGVDTSNRIVPGSWANLVKDLDAHPPAFIVDAEAAPGARYPVGQFPVLAGLLTTRYHPIAKTVDGVIYQRNSP
jgi:4-amino-4-deoxy-L-arabinose transferase-like glycosyltransferase